MTDKMLLYTRMAPARVPKRRSRAGCVYCKEKKKKCDEKRPQCDRCIERDQPCVYEPVRPRQRRKRDAAAPPSSDEADAKGQSPEDDGSADEEVVVKDDVVAEGAWTESMVVLPPSPGPSEISTKADIIGETMTELPLVLPIAMRHGQRQFIANTPPYETKNDSNADPTEWHQSAMLARRNTTFIGHEAVPISTDSRRMSYPHSSTVSIPSPSLIIPSTGQYSEFSADHHQRTLINHFDKVLSHLIVLGEETLNPFRKLVLPLALKSKAVKNALYALASAHMEQSRSIGGTTIEKGAIEGQLKPLTNNSHHPDHFHYSAILGLGQLLKMQSVGSENELLAAIMLVVYYEVLVQKHHSNMVTNHLKGALTIFGSRHDTFDDTKQFLARAFHFYDVINALSMGKRPLSTTIPAPGSLHGIPNIDTLLGLSTTLWPILHRLAALCELKQQYTHDASHPHDAHNSNPHNNINAHKDIHNEYLQHTSAEIESELLSWSPIIPPDTPASSLLDNALAYRHAALVHLYRAVYGRAQDHPSIQEHASLGLHHCAAVVRGPGSTGALLWPLFVSSCEVMGDEQQQLAAWVFGRIESRQGMINIQRARTVVEEVWRRRNEGDKYDLWRDVCREMKLAIVFG